MDIKELKLKDLQPSQFYISEKKLAKVESWFNPEDFRSFEPIPIKLLDGAYVMTDGHTRATAAIRAGLEKVPLVWDEDELSWDMYRKCVEECRARNVVSPTDLVNRIIDEKWNKWCDVMQNEITH
ncbi:MAG: ParB/RepB/Spo0J family partition protein [Clostridia bacterium]|nr:ParB/RepB/Spo0J family partition protein [Clostridia bacterium]